MLAQRKLIRLAREKLLRVYARKSAPLRASATSATIAKSRLLEEAGWQERLANQAKHDEG
jgi:hypothetical protein